jgi:hypothetical protein
MAFELTPNVTVTRDADGAVRQFSHSAAPVTGLPVPDTANTGAAQDSYSTSVR